MAYLNAEQRERLRNDLLSMNYKQAKGRLHRMDPRGKLLYWRNAQMVGEWHTRYDLPDLGTSVTLVETMTEQPTRRERISRRDYELVDVRVTPLPDNTD